MISKKTKIVAWIEIVMGVSMVFAVILWTTRILPIWELWELVRIKTLPMEEFWLILWLNYGLGGFFGGLFYIILGFALKKEKRWAWFVSIFSLVFSNLFSFCFSLAVCLPPFELYVTRNGILTVGPLMVLGEFFFPLRVLDLMGEIGLGFLMFFAQYLSLPLLFLCLIWLFLDRKYFLGR